MLGVVGLDQVVKGKRSQPILDWNSIWEMGSAA